jgi:hypothetical protein
MLTQVRYSVAGRSVVPCVIFVSFCSGSESFVCECTSLSSLSACHSDLGL